MSEAVTGLFIRKHLVPMLDDRILVHKLYPELSCEQVQFIVDRLRTGIKNA